MRYLRGGHPLNKSAGPRNFSSLSTGTNTSSRFRLHLPDVEHLAGKSGLASCHASLEIREPEVAAVWDGRGKQPILNLSEPIPNTPLLDLRHVPDTNSMDSLTLFSVSRISPLPMFIWESGIGQKTLTPTRHHHSFADDPYFKETPSQ